jgi:hypothetical protein
MYNVEKSHLITTTIYNNLDLYTVDKEVDPFCTKDY